mmetsp:Transcript_9950/g.31585  ORF Transcript_9950/g.31585 Transcript_9950/m.31585 type:complete len:446 (-) Transcript_9950:19-1356(-)
MLALRAALLAAGFLGAASLRRHAGNSSADVGSGEQDNPKAGSEWTEAFIQDMIMGIYRPQGHGLGIGETVKAMTQNLRHKAKIDRSLPPLRPWGRSFYSTDPDASAKYITRYFKHARLANSSGVVGSKCPGQTTVVEYCPKPTAPCVVMTFVKDKTKPSGKHSIDMFVNASNSEFARIAGDSMRGTRSYSPWVDFHDGWRGEDFDAQLAIQDGLQFQYYLVVLRLPFPGTMWTMELHSYDSGLQKHMIDSPDLCRRGWFDLLIAKETDSSEKGNGWWKATFGAPDPVAAADWAVKNLGAIKVRGPYPDPPVKDCVFVQWVVLPDGISNNPFGRPSGFMMHFVQEPRKWEGGNVTVKAFAEMQESVRDLEAGIFDSFMYNSLILWADSLDPYVERFKSTKTPFLARRVGDDDTFAVFVDVPGNGIVLQLRSRHLTATHSPRNNICW